LAAFSCAILTLKSRNVEITKITKIVEIES